MPSGQYPYIDIAALDAVRTRFAAGDAIAILTPALDEVIWANGPGAQLFGSSDIDSIIGAEPQIGFAAKRQITATSGYPHIGKDRAITVRLASGMTSRAMAFVASEIGLPGGEDAILLAVPAAAGGARSPADVASRAIAGLDQAGQYAAIVDAGGGIVMASSGFERLGIGRNTLAELVSEVRADRLVKRMIAAATQPLPAGFVRLTDDPATHLLVVIDEALPEHTAAPEERADTHEPANDRSAAAALAEVSNAASTSEPVLAAVEGNAAATAVEPAAAVDEGVAIALDGTPQADTGPDDALAMPLQAVQAEPISGEPDNEMAEGGNQPDDTAPAAEAVDDTVEPDNVWESNAAEQPVAPGTVEAEAEPAEAPVETQAVETRPATEAISATAEPIEAVHDSGPADGNDAVQDEADASDGIPNEQPAPIEAAIATDDAGTAGERVAATEAPAVEKHVADDAGQSAGEAAVEQGAAVAEAVSEAARQIAVDRAAAPVRFVWKTDADGRFAAISEEFTAAVGALAAAVIGRSFQDVSQSFGLDPDGEIGRLLDRRDTWSGRTVLWPVAGTDLRIPVDLAALPVYDRARKFSGFRGFGVARAGDAVVDPDAAGLALVPSPAEPPITSDAAPEAPVNEFVGDAAVAPPDDPFQGEVPILSIVPKQERRYSDKVIRLAEHRPPNGEKGLSPGERIAFREIGDRLKKDSGTAETATPALRGDNDQTPPAEPTDAAPLAAIEDLATASTEVPQDSKQPAAFGSEAAEPEGPVSPEPEMAEGAQLVPPAAVEDGDETSVAEDRIAAPDSEALQVGNDAAVVTDATPAEGDEPQSLGESPVAGPSEHRETAEAADQPAQLVDAELAMYGEAEQAAAEAEHPAEQTAAGEAGTDTSEDAQGVAEPIGETAAETVEPQSGNGAEPVASLEDTAVQPGETHGEQPQDVETDAAIGDAAAEPAAVGTAQEEEAAGSAADKGAVPDEAEEAGPTAAQLANAEALQSPDVDDDGDAEAVAEEVASGDALPTEPAAPIAEFADAGTYLPSAFSHGAAERVPVDTSILEQLPVPVLIHSGDALHYANREFLELTGYDTVDHLQAAGGLGELFGEPYPREDGSSADDEAAPGRKLRLRTSEGLEYPVEAFLQSVPWGSGKALLLSLRRSWRQPVSYPVAATPQITDPDLEARISEMRAIVDTATDGVILITSDGAIRSISRPAEALFGFDTAELAGKPFTSLFAIESQRAARDYLNGLSENGVASVLNDGREVIGREAQGRFIPLFMTIGKLPGDSGYCAVLRDITQWKRAEEELTQARAQAERASSQKTDFLARVSHEIRTPLNAIIGFSELMLDEKFGPIGSDRYRDYLRDINRSGNHVLDLVNDLLDISKIEAGQQEMSYEAVSLNDTISETVAMMQPQANRERVIIRSSFASRLPEVVADLRSVRQIALNLLSNAIRYTQAGGQVIVSTAYESSGDVVMRVRDTGVGMSQAEIEQALKPFKQINSLKRTRGDGTGLGLPLTKAMVEANRARFMINSTPGEGTLVEITFPSTRVLAD